MSKAVSNQLFQESRMPKSANKYIYFRIMNFHFKEQRPFDNIKKPRSEWAYRQFQNKPLSTDRLLYGLVFMYAGHQPRI